MPVFPDKLGKILNAQTFIDFILKEWLLVASGIGLAVTSVYTMRFPVYSTKELQVLFILLTLFISVKGLQNSGIMLKTARRIENGKTIPVKLVLTTFFLSMLVTNDIALVVLVPLTLSLHINRKDILVILEALAANAGSALTPLGNPQNLFIYWFYGIHPITFIKTIAPFSIVFLIILLVYSYLIKTKNGSLKQEDPPIVIRQKAYLYGAFLFVSLLTVLHILPLITGSLVIVFTVLFDRKTLRIDYALLFSFLFFFGLAGNIKALLMAEITHSGHIFLFSALTSQVMSNVPATLLFAKFTSNWNALLWGGNTGGFGSLFGSLANLIAYKIYVTSEHSENTASFTAKFLFMGYVAFFISIALYFFLYRI